MSALACPQCKRGGRVCVCPRLSIFCSLLLVLLRDLRALRGSNCGFLCVLCGLCGEDTPMSAIVCGQLPTADASSLEITHAMHYDLIKHSALVERKMGLKCWNNGVVEYWSSGNSNT